MHTPSLLRRIILFAAVASCLNGHGRAMAQGSSLRGLSHQSWTTEDGLPQNSVHSIAQTQDGFLWVGTESGLARFDGVRFEVFNQHNQPAMHSSDICCLLADGADGLWIGTRAGLVHRSGNGLTSYGEKDGLPSDQITGLSPAPDGALKISMGETSMRWPSARLNVPPSLSAGWSWLGQEITRTSSSGTRHWRTGIELPKGTITAFTVDRTGLAWVGMSSGVVVITPFSGAVEEVPVMKGTSVLSVFEDAAGDLWVGTESTGLHILRRLLFRSIPQLDSAATTAVVQTKDGSMWVGTRDAGLYRIQNGVVAQPVPNSALTSSVILALHPASDSEGGLWVGTPDGLNRIRADLSVEHITTTDGLPDDYIRSLAVAADGSLWVGTRHGLDHLVGRTHTILTSQDGLGGDLIGTIFVDRADTVSRQTTWIATSGGLSRVGADGTIRNYSASDGLTSLIVTAFAEDREGQLWIATRDGVIARMHDDHLQPLFPMNPAGDEAQTVLSLTFDANGSLWVHMVRGVQRIRAEQIDACRTQVPCRMQSDGITSYGRADGLSNDEAIATASAMPWLSSTGELWMPTRAGVTVADTRRLAETTPSLPIAIEAVLVDEEPVVTQGKVPEIAFGNHRLTFEYAGIFFAAPTAVRYRCRLDGFDRDWQSLGNRRTQTYTNLSPGLYTFHVQARTNDGSWGANEATIQVRILSPFYRRAWFIGLVAISIGAALAGVYLLRLRVLRQRFNAVLAERNRMAREVHDTLTQDFVSTCVQLDIVAQQLKHGHIDAATEQVQRARRFMTDGLAEARQSIWELRHSNARETLPNQIAHLVERETFASLDVKLAVQGDCVQLSSRAEREILRITNEALTNVVRHANAKRAGVTLRYDKDTMILTVQDDGAGFQVPQDEVDATHFGLMGMKERASVLDAELGITSAEGAGTTVTLRVNVRANLEDGAQHE